MPFESTFLQACARQPVPHIPVWYMRQAGRYQPEYRAIREKYTLVEICRQPELCYEVTKLPVTQLGVDAAILFSDIMIPIGAMGLDFEIKESVGPLIANPVRSKADIDRLQVFDPEEKLPHVLRSIELLKNDLTVPLIGFTGAPFTLASYMIEGRPSRNYIRTKQLMWSDKTLWKSLLDKLGAMIVRYAKAQVAAGAAAIQLFDSWVGNLSVADYREYILPTMKDIFSALKDTGVPLIYFGVQTGELLTSFAETGATVIGVDWRVPIRSARERIGYEFPVQGNLDPILLFAPWEALERRTREILDESMDKPGFIFNLGHGVTHNDPPVAVETLQRLTEFIHNYTSDKLRRS
ncbi:uroporphyrinogen decarboxylase [Alicyclobacillus ferrooxydans]|uniref:Uroporphyrinogen decarboxylase n=1 Tax=Alicyclobacillus ferrooxydans TaxID=471514 RepID=A0A0P9EHY1_9BACL|nr:uroporphyrinogen decarboxylase [Alicyclobacillus ferrooxydans]KPV42336.1 uroporphyrinogen decarboxylase [Alicyclobacillus ferrooxydans]